MADSTRRKEVAALLGVTEGEVEPVTAEAIRDAYSGILNAEELEVALHPTGEDGRPVHFWQVGSVFYLDDVTFAGDLVSFADLRYDSEIGLHIAD